MGNAGPLAGIRVLEFSQVVAGPMCGSTLAELGADVVKVEPPEGDPHRTRSAIVPLESKTFQALNRGKRSLVLDLSDERGRAVARRLAQQADVVLVNYRLGVAERLGVDYETLRALNPGLIYWQNTAWGETGAAADRPGADVVAQAYSGLMATVGRTDANDLPSAGPVPFTDILAALGGVSGICAALYHRALGGGGQYVSTSLLRSGLWAQVRQVMREPVHDVTLRDPMMEQVHALQDAGASYKEIVDLRETLNPILGAGTLYYQSYRAKDGFLSLGAVTLRTRERVRDLLGVPDEDSDAEDYDAADPANIERMRTWREVIAAKFREKTVDEWLALLEQAGVPASPINFAEDMADDPLVEGDEMMVDLVHPITGPQRVVGPIALLSETPTSVPRPA
ncbi:MAG: CoA transferase, partial [Dehalococcoidia bacterium]